MSLDRDELRFALESTARSTGFSPMLIEKDYHCSLLLKTFYEAELVREKVLFKGGTLLAKAHSAFERLSEDLDFAVINAHCASRGERRRVAAIVGSELSRCAEVPPFLGVKSDWIGHNNSTQYTASLAYETFDGLSGTILFEVGFRGDMLEDPETVPVRTLLIDPFSRLEVLKPFLVTALSKHEAFAEKVRAALTRREPAIRDWYDVTQALRANSWMRERPFLSLVKQKLAAQPTVDLRCTKETKEILRAQIESDLRPVLRESAIQQFSFDEAWDAVIMLHRMVVDG